MRYSPLALLVASVFAAGAAQAANTITFKGEITDQTCKVAIKGATDLVVELPKVSQADLKAPNSSAGEKPFTLSVTDCSANGSARSVKIKLNNMQLDNGNLANIATTGGATKVVVQLLDENKAPITLENHYEVDMGTINNVDGTVADKNFFAQYISKEGDATAGQVNSVIEYELTYL